MKPTRKELIELCELAVVHHTKWMDRDSYMAQQGIKSIYKGLTAGLKYKILTKRNSKDYYSDKETWKIQFTHDELEKLENGKELKISSREDYYRDCDPDFDSEMFEGVEIDFTSTWCAGYLPTLERITEVGLGNDWY
jgi:hypothetical protein